MEYIHSFILQAKNRVKWDEEKSHTVKMTEAMYLKMVRLSFYTFFIRNCQLYVMELMVRQINF